jgi:alcohol dehydrogenase class IV
VDDLCLRAGPPRRLRDVGAKEEVLPALAEKVFAEAGLAFNRRAIRSIEEIQGVLRAAW